MPDHQTVPIGISNRHVHLSNADLNMLFGDGYQLTKVKDLSQPGQFVCKETIAVIGPKGTLPKVRILGPTRKQTQVEISKTDCYVLGVDAPIRDSGDLINTPGITLKGPLKEIIITNGVICAQRHLHLSISEGQTFNLADKQLIDIRVEGERAITFHHVLVRVGNQYAMDFHIDTDEANAAGIKNGCKGIIC